jgi:site-specific recombinase XerD
METTEVRLAVLAGARDGDASNARNLPVAIPVQASNDLQLFDLWLHGRSNCTRRAYASDIRSFMDYAEKGLREVTLGDMQAWTGSIADRASSTQARMIAAVKSLLSFACKLGYVSFNVGGVVKGPKVKNTLAERILSEGDLLRMLLLETNARNKALLYFVYDTGCRVSEVVGLTWADLRPEGDSAIATLLGKGGKTRFNRLTPTTWGLLQAIRPAGVSSSALDPSMAWRIVKTAAARAGLSEAVSTHWLRHGHATHAMNRGAKIHEVTAQLGHSSAAVTSMYLHVNPEVSTSRYLVI